MSLLQVSSRRDKRVSSFSCLSFFSFSISTLILFTISLSISKIASSVSSLAFFSLLMISVSLSTSSSILDLTWASLSSLSTPSDLITSYNLGKSFSKQDFRCSMLSYLFLDSLLTSFFRVENLSSTIPISLFSISFLAIYSCSNLSYILTSSVFNSYNFCSYWYSLAYLSSLMYLLNSVIFSLKALNFLLLDSCQSMILSSV